MAYSIVTDIQSEFKDVTFSSTTKVTDTEVTEFIVQADAYIDGRLGTRFLTPITGLESLKIIKNISIWLVTDRVREIMQVKNIVEIPLQQGTHPKSLDSKAKAMLDEILKGKIALPDAPLISTTDGFRSFATDVGLKHTFKKGVDQW